MDSPRRVKTTLRWKKPSEWLPRGHGFLLDGSFPGTAVPLSQGTPCGLQERGRIQEGKSFAETKRHSFLIQRRPN